MPSFAVILYGKLLYFEQYQRLLILALREPNATAVEKQGLGYVVAYVGTLGGEVPYTAYNARKSYLEENKDKILGFSKAVDKGLKFVLENDPEVVAKSIIEFFPDTSIDDLTTMINRYKEGDAWRSSITINEDEWKHIQDIMIASGELDSYVSYNELIYDEYFKEFK